MADTPKALAPLRLFGHLSKDAQALQEARMAAHMPHSGDTTLPLKLPRTNLSNEFIMGEAERIARQMMGEHVTSGKKGDTKNLSGKSMKEAQRVKGIPYQLREVGTVAPETTYVPKVGEVRVTVPGDQTVSNAILESLHNEPNLAEIQGGSKYGLGAKHLPIPEFWKSGPRPATSLQNKVDRLYDLYEPSSVVGSHMSMGPTSNNFAMHQADATLRAIDYSKLHPEAANKFDEIIANGYYDSNKKKHIEFPNWAGIADPQGALMQMAADPELRKWFNNRFKVPKVTKPLGLPNGLDVQYAISEPALRDMEINVVGLSNGRMIRGAPVEEAGKSHNTYSHRIQGIAEGPTENLESFVMAYPDAADYIAKTKRPADFTGTIQKVFPHQVVDDQYLNQLGEYHNRVNQLIKGGGKKRGGSVAKASKAEALFKQKVQELISEHHKANGGGISKPVKEEGGWIYG
jgi:hypothetical protein